MQRKCNVLQYFVSFLNECDITLQIGTIDQVNGVISALFFFLEKLDLAHRFNCLLSAAVKLQSNIVRI